MSLVVIDTGVWARLRQPDVAEEIAAAVEAGAVALPTTIVLELLRSARNAAEWAQLDEEYRSLREIPITPEIERRAREVQGLLTRRGWHRGPSPVDLLTAAATEAIDGELWHCDKHFELIASVSRLKQRRLGR